MDSVGPMSDIGLMANHLKFTNDGEILSNANFDSLG